MKSPDPVPLRNQALRNEGPHTSAEDADVAEARILRFTEAVYSLELQKLQLLIDRLKQPVSPPESGPVNDYVIRPGRAA